jgi:hypothetical protein
MRQVLPSSRLLSVRNPTSYFVRLLVTGACGLGEIKVVISVQKLGDVP